MSRAVASIRGGRVGGGGGGGSPTFTLAGVYADDFATGTGASASIEFRNDGQLRYTNGTPAYVSHGAAWMRPLDGVEAALYDVEAVLVSGTTPQSGTMNARLGLGTTRSWTLSRPVLGTNTCTVQFTIRRTSDNTIMVQQNVVMTAERT